MRDSVKGSFVKFNAARFISVSVGFFGVNVVAMIQSGGGKLCGVMSVGRMVMTTDLITDSIIGAVMMFALNKDGVT